MHSFIYLFCSLSYDRSIASSRGGSPKCNLVLLSFSICLHLLPHFPVTSILLSIFPSIMCFTRQFLCKIWLTELASILCIVYGIFLSTWTVCNTFSFLTRLVLLIVSSFLQHHIWKLARDSFIYLPWNWSLLYSCSFWIYCFCMIMCKVTCLPLGIISSNLCTQTGDYRSTIQGVANVVIQN